MKFNCLDILNLDYLHNFIYEKKSKRENDITPYGCLTKSILDRISIHMNLDKVNIYEMMYLKNISTRMYIANYSRSVDDFSIDISDEYKDSISNIYNLFNYIKKDDKEDYINLFLPAMCMNFSCDITITGKDIFQFFGTDLEKMFYMNINGKDTLISSKELTESEITNVKDRLLTIFFKSFYQGLDAFLLSNDDFGNTIIDSEYELIEESTCLISEIHAYPDINIKLINSTDEHLGEKMKSMRENKNKPYSEELFATFICNTDLLTFLHIYLNTEYVNCFKPLKRIKEEQPFYVPEELRSEYSVRVNSLFSSLVNEFQYQLNKTDDTMFLEKLLYAPCNTRMQFVLKIPFIEMQGYINSISTVSPNLHTMNEILTSIESAYKILHQVLTSA